MALRVASIVAAESITAPVSGHRNVQACVLANLLELHFEYSRIVPVNNRNPYSRVIGENRCQWLQMKASVHVKLGRGRRRRDIKLLPDSPRMARKYCLRAGLIPMKPLGHLQDALEISDSITALALHLNFLQCL